MAFYNSNQCFRDDSLCPIDRVPIKPNEIFKDKAIAKEILHLKCYCSNKNYGCEWIGEVAQVKQHYTICEYHIMKCEFCREEYRVPDQYKHLKHCPGLLRTSEFPLESVGCTHKAITTEQGNTYNSLGIAVVQAQTDIKKLYQQIEDLLKSYHQQQQIIDNFKQQTTENFHLLNIHSHQQTTQKSSQSTAVITNTLVSLTRRVDEVFKTVSTLSTNISNIELRQQLYQNITYDGHLIWKIDKYKHRRNNAVIGKVTALHSAPCFTHRYGHKFCGRLYLNGDGMGKMTHISLYVVIMKSEYDNILEWPFQKRFSFTLINQRDRAKNITEIFIPAKNSSSFKQPTKEINIASGCPLFASIEMVENNGFVKEDSIFIELKVID